MLKELIVIPPEGMPCRQPIGDGDLTIGRSPTCDLVVLDPSLSRQHALIRRRDVGWEIADLGSRNGTMLNGDPITEPRRLDDGDRIAIGSSTLICVADEPAADAGMIPPLEPAHPPPTKPGPGPLRFPGHRLTVTVSDLTPIAFGRASILFRSSSDEGRELCVKMFHHTRGFQFDNLSEFEREVKVQTSLDHPSVLPVIDYGTRSEPSGCPFVVFPFCRGGNLRSLLDDRAFYSLESVLPLLKQVADAIDFAHSSGVIHGDVKPENILLSADRTKAFLSDFGMANVFSMAQGVTTVSGIRDGGTTAYLSPEKIANNEQSPLSDIYALTMSAYELLTGRLPFGQNQPPFRQMMAKVNGEVLDPQGFNPRISDATKAALLTGLNIDPLKRPKSGAELCALLAAGKTTVAAATPGPKAHRVFVSYSHQDIEWFERIRVHLRPLERQGLIEVWSDTRIRPGMEWSNEIEDALISARVAVLLVSAHFLASAFCTEEEIPKLLQNAERRGTVIIPVVISPCQFAAYPTISRFQALNDPEFSLVEMAASEQERALTCLAGAISEAINTG